MEKIDIYIFSCNRTAQLDLLLRSIKDNFLNVGSIHLMYNYHEYFIPGIQAIMEKDYGLDIEYYKNDQTTFELVFRQIVNKEINTEFLIGFCDDDVFIRNKDVSNILPYYDESVMAFSLRASKDLTLSYHKPFVIHKPNMIVDSFYLKWNWKTSQKKSSWAYPCAVGGFIYRSDLYREKVSKVIFSNPSILEVQLFKSRKSWNRCYMIASPDTAVLDFSVNKVQTINNKNPAGKYFFQDEKDLHDVFMSGKAISTKDLYDFKNKCQFEEVIFEFV